MGESDLMKKEQGLIKDGESALGVDVNDQPNSLRRIIASRKDQTNSIIRKIGDATIAAGIVENISTGKSDETRFVVNITKETAEAIKQGVVKLDRDKDGNIYAQLRDGNHYGKKLSISEELVEQGVDPLDAVNALQLKAIQDKLEDIAEAIDAISEDVETVIRGQQNDRLGLFFSGQELLNEAQMVQDPMLKNLLTSQALKSLSDASAQMSLQLKSDVDYLVEGRYDKKKGKRDEEIAARMESINKCFEAVHRSSLLKATAYLDSGEIRAMLALVSDYGHFLEEVVVPNSAKLAEFDRKDNLLRGGKWSTRSCLLTGVEELKGQLAEGSSFYLEAPIEEGGADEG